MTDRCTHFDETQAVIDANPHVAEFRESNPWPSMPTYPTWPADEIKACPDRCHDVWKIINGWPIPDRTPAP